MCLGMGGAAQAWMLRRLLHTGGCSLGRVTRLGRVVGEAPVLLACPTPHLGSGNPYLTLTALCLDYSPWSGTVG